MRDAARTGFLGLATAPLSSSLPDESATAANAKRPAEEEKNRKKMQARGARHTDGIVVRYIRTTLFHWSARRLEGSLGSDIVSNNSKA